METNSATISSENERLKSANQTLELSLHEAQNSQQGSSGDPEEVNNLKEVISRLKQDKEVLQVECKTMKEKVETVEKELDDLLVLLTDTDNKKDKYKEKLKELGQAISDDDLGDEDGDELEEEEEDDDEASWDPQEKVHTFYANSLEVWRIYFFEWTYLYLISSISCS